MYNYSASINAVIAISGPSKDDGLPFDNPVNIQAIEGDINRLYLPIVLSGIDTPGTLVNHGSRPAGQSMGHRTPAFKEDAKQRAFILQGTEGDAWNVIYSGDFFSNKNFTGFDVGTVNDKYGIYFAQEDEIRFLPLHSGIFNANKAPDRAYVKDEWVSLKHSTFNAEDISVDKSLTDIFVECDLPDGTELSVCVIFDNDPSNCQQFVNIAGPFTGRAHVELPNPIMPIGREFDSFQLVVYLRTDDELVTPTLRGLEVSFRRTLPSALQFTVLFPINEKNPNIGLIEALRDVYKRRVKSALKLGDKTYWVYLTNFSTQGAPEVDIDKVREITATFQEG